MQLRYSPRPPYGFICIEGVLYFGKSTTEHRNGVFEPFWGHFLRANVRTSVPPSRAQEPARQALDPASQASESARQASEPASQASEPASQAS